MYIYILSFILILNMISIGSTAMAQTRTDQPSPLFGDVDGTNAGRYRSVKFSNGTTTNNGDGSITVATGGGSGSPGGSPPQLQWNNGGSFAGVSGSGVDSNGNIGIGSVNPVEKLEVIGKTKTTDLQISSISGATSCLQADISGNISGTGSACGAGGATPAGGLGAVQYNSPIGTLAGNENVLYTDGTNVGIGTNVTTAGLNIVYSGVSYALRVDDQNSDTNYFFVDRDGNVGIGTSIGIAQSKLYVYGTSWFNQNVGIGTFTNPSSNHAQLEIIRNTNNIDGLRVNDNGINDTTPFIINSTGNIGIGTTSSVGPYSGDRIAFLGTSSSGPVYVGNKNYDFLIGNTIDSGAKFRMLPYLGDIYFENFTPSSGSVSGNIIFRHVWNSGASVREDFRVDVNGNMGIGLTAPKALLEVATTAAQDLFRVSDSGSGDTTPFVINSIGNVGIGTTAPMALFEITQISSWDSFRVNDTGPDSSPFIIDSEGNVGIGTLIPKYGLDISDGQYALVIGADNATRTRTNATQKISRFGGAHYTNSEKPVAFFSSNSGNGFNNISFGGGTSLMNAATNLYFYTASNGTTTTGTARMLIDGTGNIGIGTTVLDSGVLQLPQNGTSQGHAACWGTNNCAGYCTDVVGVTGTCTCTCL